MKYVNNKGFSLVEIAVVLVILTILFLVIGLSGKGMFDNGRVNSAAQSVETLRSAAAQYLASGNVTYAQISLQKLKDGNLLPSGFSSTGSNSFGGDYTIAANGTDNTKVDITLGSVPQDSATKLTTMFNSKADSIAYDATGKTWKVTF